MALLGFAVVLVAMVAIGISGRIAGPGAGEAGPGDGGAEPGTAAATAGPPAATPRPSLPRFEPDDGPVYTSEPGPFELAAKRHPETVFVHGDLHAEHITWIFVSVRDELGRVAGWSSVSVPGAVGRNTTGGPAVRFDVEFAIRDEFGGPLVVRAQAYDDTGRVVASSGVLLPVSP